MRSAGTIPSLFAALAVLAAAVGARAAGTTPTRLTIAFTGDVSGYLEPCG